LDQSSFDSWAATRRAPPGLWLERPNSLLPFLRRQIWRPVRRHAFNALTWLIGEYRNGIDQALDVREYGLLLPVPGLDPNLDGFTILHLSDLHLGQFPGLTEAIEHAVKDLQPDVCVLTGDYAPTYKTRPDHVLAALRPILERIDSRHGFYATLGNYDSPELAAALQHDGKCRLLINEHAAIRHHSALVHLTGTDDPYLQDNGPILEALAAPREGFGESFRIALVHTPDLAGEAAAAGYDLYLCGHTHGGQICRPSGRPILKNCKKRPDLASGLWREGGMWGYTSRGAGVSGIPRRHYCPPEVTMIRLVAGAPLAA